MLFNTSIVPPIFFISKEHKCNYVNFKFNPSLIGLTC